MMPAQKSGCRGTLKKTGCRPRATETAAPHPTITVTTTAMINGFAATAPKRSPVITSVAAVVIPQNGQGTPVNRRKGHKTVSIPARFQVPTANVPTTVAVRRSRQRISSMWPRHKARTGRLKPPASQEASDGVDMATFVTELGQIGAVCFQPGDRIAESLISRSR